MSRRLIETLLMPPASALWLFLLGCLLVRRWKRIGRALQVAGIAWIWLASTPLVGGALLHSLEGEPALPATGALPKAQAIVVLSAEADRFGQEYGGAVIGPMTMQRLRYGAWLQRRTGLPLLVSGGVPGRDLRSLADLMADAAKNELGVPVRWIESRSADTRENAQFSAELLRKDGVTNVLLVSSAWHLPRAMACFRKVGITPIGAPTAFRSPVLESWSNCLPSWAGLRDTCLGLHEWGGRLFYAVSG